MRILLNKPELLNLSVGGRIAFLRDYRRLTQDKLASLLNLTDENRRRTITRYEKNQRIPKMER